MLYAISDSWLADDEAESCMEHQASSYVVYAAVGKRSLLRLAF